MLSGTWSGPTVRPAHEAEDEVGEVRFLLTGCSWHLRFEPQVGGASVPTARAVCVRWPNKRYPLSVTSQRVKNRKKGVFRA